jgi:hypothetical protein
VARASTIIQQNSGESRTLFVPGRRIDGFDLMLSRNKHQRIVRADHVLRAGASVESVHGAKVYIVDGRQETPAQLVATLASFRAEVAQEQLTSASLSRLA